METTSNEATRKGLIIKVLLVIFSLEVGKLVSIFYEVTIRFSKEPTILEPILLLQIQAVVAALAVLSYLFISLSQSSSKGADTMPSDTIATTVAMVYASSFSLLHELVKASPVSDEEFLKFFLLTAAFVSLLTALLLRRDIRSQKAWRILGHNVTRLIFSGFLCLSIGFVIHQLLLDSNNKPVYGTEDLLGLGVCWYIAIRLPSSNISGPSIQRDIVVWEVCLLVLGAIIGAIYGLFLYSGNSFYSGVSEKLAAGFVWATYGVIPSLVYVAAKYFRHGSARVESMMITSATLIFVATSVLHVMSYGFDPFSMLVLSSITALSSILIFVIPKLLFRGFD